MIGLSSHEQLVICIRRIDNKLEAREDLIILHILELEGADASTITALLEDYLI